MLSPQDRNHLLSVLRPPSGYELEYAIGTTYSLDLYTLLTVPLAFTLFDFENDQGLPNADPLALLEAVRRHADKIVIFCQTGRIQLPNTKSSRLLCYLENSIIEVEPKSKMGVFHPKVWILRFESNDGPVIYRVLCLSRNLTYDRSWDTVLALDGEVQDRERAYAGNHPLGNFINALPELAIHAVSSELLKDIDYVQDEIRRVKFELPPNFSEVGFWPLGIEEKNKEPFDFNYKRILVMSPFLSKGRIEYLSDVGSNNVLISSSESLDELDEESLANYSNVYVLDTNATPEPEEQAEDDEKTSESIVEDETGLQGLHAKLFIAEEGWNAHLFTGSANATNAAFQNNVEFLVELVGKRSRYGIDQFLQQSTGETGFRDLLHEYAHSEKTETDDVQKRLEQRIENVRRDIARCGLKIEVTGPTDNDTYQIKLFKSSTEKISLQDNVEVICWPITLNDAHGLSPNFNQEPTAHFKEVSFDAITPFMAFSITARQDDKTSAAKFVLNLPMEGAPEDRREKVLRSLVQNKEQFIRFLMLLLYEGGMDFSDKISAIKDFLSGKTDLKKGDSDIFVFEVLLRALERNPKKLNQVARLVTDLCNTPGGKECLP
ncbi:MAG TPA: phospholipase D family protein, partial [Alphaproteobacteria bacterium]|nr:phospholipase D family protein [Alphaproteobacteria bacterium]